MVLQSTHLCKRSAASLALLMVLGASPAVSASPEDPSSTELWDWYGEATELHDAGKLDEAYEIYKRIWRHRQTYDVAAGLGDIWSQRAHYALAAKFYRFALDNMVVTQSPDFVASLNREFDRVRKEVTAVNVELSPSEITDVSVTNPSTGETYTAPIYLDPGHYTLQFEAPGYQPSTHEVTATRGGEVTVPVEMRPAAAPVGTKPSRLTKTRHPEIVFPIGGLLTAGLATGAVLTGLDAADKYDAGENSLADLGTTGCYAQNTPRCVALQDNEQDAKQAQLTSWLLGGGALLTAGATVAVWLLWETDTEVDVAVGSTGANVRWTYAF